MMWNSLQPGDVVMHAEGDVWVCVGRSAASTWDHPASYMLLLTTSKNRVERWDHPGEIAKEYYEVIEAGAK